MCSWLLYIRAVWWGIGTLLQELHASAATYVLPDLELVPCSAVAGLRQLLSGPGSWRTSESSSGGGSTKPQSSEDGTDATRQQLADLLHRRAANDLQVRFPLGKSMRLLQHGAA